MKKVLSLVLVSMMAPALLAAWGQPARADSCPHQIASTFPPGLQRTMNGRYVYSWFVYTTQTSASVWTFANTQEVKENFTPQGWQDFNSFLDKITSRNFFKDRSDPLTVVSFFTTAPYEMFRGPIKDAQNEFVSYRWIYSGTLHSTIIDRAHGSTRTEIESHVLISVISTNGKGNLKIESWRQDPFADVKGNFTLKQMGEVNDWAKKNFVWKSSQSSGGLK